MSDTSAPVQLRIPNELERAATLLEELPGAVLLLDAAGHVRYMNPVAEKRLDRLGAQTVGRDLFQEVLPELGAEGASERYRRAVAEHPAELGWETTVRGPQGDRPLRLAIRTFEQEGRRWALVSIDDRSTEVAEVQRRKRAERLAAVGELATGAAHEINNPLASIKGFAQLLARETLDRGQQQALEIISQESTRVAGIVDSLLAFATQQRVADREKIDLSVLTAEVLALKRYSLETSGVALEEDFDEGLSAVDAEKGALQRLVLILLHQAERSLILREESRALTIRTRETNEGVVLYVIDNGPGISRDLLPRMLIGDGDPDVGLGPSTANRIVLDHGGTLVVESSEGKGTTFTVRLPRSGALEEEAPSPVYDPPAVDEHAPIRVLVADDEPTLRLALAMFLSRHGYEVEQAEDADSAYQLALTGRFDVALVDARMPGDGLVLLNKLDSTPDWRGRAILMTGDHMMTRVRDEIRGGRPHLTKPFDMMEAVRMIDSVSGGAGTRQQGSRDKWTSS